MFIKLQLNKVLSNLNKRQLIDFLRKICQKKKTDIIKLIHTYPIRIVPHNYHKFTKNIYLDLSYS